MEKASRKPSHFKRDIQEIPEFRNHLRREGIDMETFLRRQRAQEGDEVSADLQLRHKKIALKQGGRGYR